MSVTMMDQEYGNVNDVQGALAYCEEVNGLLAQDIKLAREQWTVARRAVLELLAETEILYSKDARNTSASERVRKMFDIWEDELDTEVDAYIDALLAEENE